MMTAQEAQAYRLNTIQMHASGCSHKACPRYDLEISLRKKKIYYWGFENVRKTGYESASLQSSELARLEKLFSTFECYEKDHLFLGAWLKKLGLDQLPRPYVAMRFSLRETSMKSQNLQVFEFFQPHGLSNKGDRELTRLESECARLAVDRGWV